MSWLALNVFSSQPTLTLACHKQEKVKVDFQTRVPTHFFSFDRVNHGFIETSFTVRHPHAFLSIWWDPLRRDCNLEIWIDQEN